MENDLGNEADYFLEAKNKKLSSVLSSIIEQIDLAKNELKKKTKNQIKEDEQLNEDILRKEIKNNNLKIPFNKSKMKILNNNEEINKIESMSENIVEELKKSVSLNEDSKYIEKIQDSYEKDPQFNTKIKDFIENLYLLLNKLECENTEQDFQMSTKQDSFQNQQVDYKNEKQIVSEFKMIKDLINEKFSNLNEKLDSKSKVDNLMSLNNRSDREHLFKIVLKEINELKSMMKNFQLPSDIPASLSENSIFLRFDSLIPIHEDSLIQNLDPDAFKTHHSPEWLCLALFDLVKKNKLNSNAINKVFEILNKILNFLKEDQLNLVEELLNDVKNASLSAKYELLCQFISMHPHRKIKLMQIFIRDLEYLIKSTNEDVLDYNFQVNNPEIYLNLKKILKMANYTVYREIDLDTINVLKRTWSEVHSRPILQRSNFNL